MKAPAEFEDLAKLPSGWTWQPLQTLTVEPRQHVVDGPFGSNLKASEYVDEGVPIARLQNIDRNEFIHKNIRFITDSKAQELARHEFKAGDILVTKLGDPLGKACIVPPHIGTGIIVADLVRVRVDERKIDRKYLTYAINSPAIIRQLEKHTKGTTRPRVNLEIIRELPIPVAPRDQQVGIVADIDKQFSRLDEAVANLNRVKDTLKRYKASVLRTATEGTLVPTDAQLAKNEARAYESGEQLLSQILHERRSAWGKDHPRVSVQAYPAPTDPRKEDLYVIPEGWAWATAEQLNAPGRPCAYGVLQPGDDVTSGVPLVRVGDIFEGQVDQKDLKRINPSIASKYPRTRLEGGELLITLVGAIGRTAVAPQSLRGANVARAVGVIPLTVQVNPRWVEIWFRNPRKVAEMNRRSHEVARKTLNLEDVRAAAIALPPIVEQERIATEVDRLFSIADDQEREIERAIRLANRFRQSVLYRSFGNGLVYEGSA